MDIKYQREKKSQLIIQAERVFSAVTAIERGLERDHFRAEFDLTHPQLMTMVTIARCKQCTMSELGRITGYPTSALTGIIDRLIGKKLVVRVRDNQDRRIVHVSLTPSGVRLADKLRDRILTHTARVLEMVGAAEREKMIQTVEKIADAFVKKVKTK
jgi:DNA-binding MarR family transcriptional regulator